MYYTSKVKIATDTPKGVKWQSETYLVDALTVTHAEAQVNEDFKDSGVEFEVKSVSKSQICKVIESSTKNS